MSQLKRAAHPPGALPEMLINHAIELLDEAGPDAVTIRAVARRAGVSHAAPANHFHNRRHLLTEVATRIFRCFILASTVDPVNGSVSHTDVARSYMRNLAMLGLEHPSRFELLWRSDLIDWEDATLKALMDDIYMKFVESVSPIASARRLDPESIAVALWSAVQGYTTLRTSGIFEERLDAVTHQPRLETILDIILGGSEI